MWTRTRMHDQSVALLVSHRGLFYMGLFCVWSYPNVTKFDVTHQKFKKVSIGVYDSTMLWSWQPRLVTRLSLHVHVVITPAAGFLHPIPRYQWYWSSPSLRVHTVILDHPVRALSYSSIHISHLIDISYSMVSALLTVKEPPCVPAV